MLFETGSTVDIFLTSKELKQRGSNF